MLKPVESSYLVPFDGSFSIDSSPSAPPAEAPSKKKCKERLGDLVDELQELQRVLYADNRYAVLLVFQAMDAAGKDGTIRAVLTGVNPAGCQVTSFKQPSSQELEHDFLWRTVRALPERGRIGVFNRSYYEEVLIVRVHPEILALQNLPQAEPSKELWKGRFHSICDHEQHLARNGTIVLKFWLNVSPEEQRERFLERIDEPEKNWKFSRSDVEERGHWEKYMTAYEEALCATSRSCAPWYAIPADNKPFMRLCVADIIVRTLQNLDLAYPQVTAEQRKGLSSMRKILKKDQ